MLHRLRDVKVREETSSPTPSRVATARDELTELFDESYDSVFRYCLARTGSMTLSEDISAEVFAELARRFAGGFDEHVSIGWLLKVAQRRLIDHWRANERHRRRLQRIAIERTPDVVVEREVDERVINALRSLSQRQRAALTLRYLDDLSVQEVAEVLGCRYQAAESLLARARRSFASAYEEQT